MRVFLVLLLVGMVSQSQASSYEDGDHLSAEWNHGQSSHEDSVGSENSSKVALANGYIEVVREMERELAEPQTTTKEPLVKIYAIPYAPGLFTTKKPAYETGKPIYDRAGRVVGHGIELPPLLDVPIATLKPTAATSAP